MFETKSDILSTKC